ncbi:MULTISPECIES: phenylpyruvate tautomerase MIF-related protein [Spirulina sp. CCY15215]|uniref:phenylpyruvate tautomerase MIF-related protein n=1 Tax=Spirulina sp. CCY15215 TaxID=2767591 RepID=UPI0019504B6F|nr:phenylpyruvate tautomerase MIF-related protein [Spirulina major]
MPLIKVQSTESPDAEKVKILLKSLSEKLAQHLGKPESYVMTAFEGNVPMTFAGSPDRVCFLEIKSIGTMKPEQTKAMSQDFCHTISQDLGVPGDRIYIEFADAERHLWGWKGTTF